MSRDGSRRRSTIAAVAVGAAGRSLMVVGEGHAREAAERGPSPSRHRPTQRGRSLPPQERLSEGERQPILSKRSRARPSRRRRAREAACRLRQAVELVGAMSARREIVSAALASYLLLLLPVASQACGLGCQSMCCGSLLERRNGMEGDAVTLWSRFPAQCIPFTRTDSDAMDGVEE